jgi:hypothetical protein
MKVIKFLLFFNLMFFITITAFSQSDENTNWWEWDSDGLQNRNAHFPDKKDVDQGLFTYRNGYKVYNGFLYLLDEKLWNCWAQRPASHYRKHICRLCGNVYYSQTFYDKNGDIQKIVSNFQGCPYSHTRNCDNLDLSEIGPCKCEGVEYYK